MEMLRWQYMMLTSQKMTIFGNNDGIIRWCNATDDRFSIFCNDTAMLRRCGAKSQKTGILNDNTGNERNKTRMISSIFAIMQHWCNRWHENHFLKWCGKTDTMQCQQLEDSHFWRRHQCQRQHKHHIFQWWCNRQCEHNFLWCHSTTAKSVMPKPAGEVLTDHHEDE